MFNYKWTIKDIKNNSAPYHGSTVFSTFSCGGGSSFGYKLAGFDVVAANDIDPQMKNVYVKNHNPKYFYLNDIRSLLLKDFPKDLKNLDILDGSPPCSTFSMSGSREKAWGKEKKFREGQAMQTLDDLFFDFIALAQKLKPKIVISENVKGLIQGNAKGYVAEIIKKFDEAGYNTQIFLLNAATMGVPQRRQRVFFLSRRKDLKLQDIKLEFNEPPILFGQVRSKEGSIEGLSNTRGELIKFRLPMDKSINDINLRLYNKTSGFNARIRHDDEVCRTITSGEIDYRYFDGKVCTKEDYINCGSFPQDYNFLDIKPKYLIGMSVPPVAMAQISYQVYKQWLKQL